MIIFFKLESFTKHLTMACYVCRTDSWSFWIFEWMPLWASSFQQYIIGTQERHIFPFFHELLWLAGTFLSGPCSHSPVSLIICSLLILRHPHWGVHWGVGCLGRWVREVSIIFAQKFFFTFSPCSTFWGKKIHGNNCLLNNSPSPHPPFLLGEGCFKQWPC